MPRLLYLTTTGNMNGAEKELMYLLNNWDHKKFSVAICTLKDEGELFSMIKDQKVRKYTLGIRSKWEFWKLLRLIPILRKEQPDIINSMLDYDNWVARLFGRGRIVINGQMNANPFRPRWRDFLDFLTKGLVDYYISNNYKGKEMIISKHLFNHPEKISVVPQGIDLSAYKTPKKINLGKKFNIVAVGRLTGQKNFSTLISACKGLEGIRITILGQGELEDELRAQAGKLGVDLVLPGFVTNVKDYLHSADLFVLTSAWEGLPNVVMEAMASRKAIIATPAGDTETLIEDGKEGRILRNPFDHRMLRRLIISMKDDPEMRKFFADNAYLKITDYSLERFVNKNKACLEEIAELSGL